MEIQYGGLNPKVVHLVNGLRCFIEICYGNRFPTSYRDDTNGNSI